MKRKNKIIQGNAAISLKKAIQYEERCTKALRKFFRPAVEKIYKDFLKRTGFPPLRE